MNDGKFFKVFKIITISFVVVAVSIFVLYSYSIKKTGNPIIEDHEFIKEPIYFPWTSNDNYYLITDYSEYDRLMRKSEIAKKEDFEKYNVLVVKSNYRYCNNKGKEVITDHKLESNKMTINISYSKPCNVKDCSFKKKVSGYYYMLVPKEVISFYLDYKEVDTREC